MAVSTAAWALGHGHKLRKRALRAMKPPPAGAAPRASAAFGATFMQEGKKYQFKYEYRQKYPVPAKFEYRMYGFTRTLKITILAAAITVSAPPKDTSRIPILWNEL